MIKCVIIDDEPLAIKILQKYFQECSDLQLVAHFTDAMEGQDFLNKNEIDLLFLDINMPELDGLSLINILDNPPVVIFTTAHPDYAVQSYEYEAVDYLLKPFSQGRFLKAIERARDRLKIETKSSTDNFLAVKADRKLFRLPHDEISFLQAYGDYVKIRTNNNWIVPKITLAQIEKELPNTKFLRTHRTYIINMEKVQYLEGNQLAIGEEKIPISKGLKEQVLKKLGL